MKRILLVDDERAILEGLRCRLRRAGRKWEIDCVESGALAIEHMQRQPYEVIVTDFHMPNVDGAQLLEIVSGRWPQTVRIVLSGYADLQQTIRLVPFAHRYLSKPCEGQQLEEVIDRCLLLHELLQGSDLRALVGRIRQLPSLPRIYSALQVIVKDEKATVRDVAQLIAADSAIAARVLQIVNSAFFRLARRITNIEQAVSYLGFSAIRNVATAVAIFAQWRGQGASPIDPDRLQLHVGAVAAAAHALTVKTVIADDTILAGLLHDIGYWVLAQECSVDLNTAVNLATTTAIPLHQAETEVMGASHAEVGAYLLGLWGLPHPVIEAVAHHHQPQRVSQTTFDVLGALAIADALVPTHDAEAFNLALTTDPELGQSYLTSLNAPFDWSEAQQRVAEAAKPEEFSS